MWNNQECRKSEQELVFYATRVEVEDCSETVTKLSRNNMITQVFKDPIKIGIEAEYCWDTVTKHSQTESNYAKFILLDASSTFE